MDEAAAPTVRSRGRLKRRNIAPKTTIIHAGLKRQIPPYDMMSEEGLELIEDKTDEILQEVGVEFRGDDEALRIWRQALTSKVSAFGLIADFCGI